MHPVHNILATKHIFNMPCECVKRRYNTTHTGCMHLCVHPRRILRFLLHIFLYQHIYVFECISVCVCGVPASQQTTYVDWIFACCSTSIPTSKAPSHATHRCNNILGSHDITRTPPQECLQWERRGQCRLVCATYTTNTLLVQLIWAYWSMLYMHIESLIAKALNWRARASRKVIIHSNMQHSTNTQRHNATPALSGNFSSSLIYMPAAAELPEDCVCF